jgi:hypothetical protein
MRGPRACQDANVEPINAADSAIARIAVAVQASMDDMVAAAVQEIWDQVPAYPGSNDPGLREDVARHVRAIFDVFLAGLTGGRPTRRSEFTMTRQQATRRVAQGITLADFLQAFRIGQLTLWQGVLAAAGDDAAAREEALAAVARIMTVIEVGSTVAAEAYLEAQQHAVAESDRVRRDLLEDLLARRTSFTGPKRAMLRAAGPDTRLLVTSAVLAGDQSDDHALRDAALAVGRTRGTGGRSLVVVRQDEMVLISPVPRDGAAPVVAGLRRPRVLRHMLTPRRHRDPRYAMSIAGEIYGGSMRSSPVRAAELLHAGGRAGAGPRLLLPVAGECRVDQPAAAAAAAPADPGPGR